MDAEDRRLLVDTNAKVAVTAQKVDDFIAWSQEVHNRRDEEIKDMCEKITDHAFYIRLLKWVITPLTPMGILGLILAVFQWIKAHAAIRP
jgi:hypothetical protein